MFSKNLKYYRLKRNLTKRALADACGLSSMAISNYEKGIRNPDIEIINKLAKVLDVTIADFLEVRNASIHFEHKVFVSIQPFRKERRNSSAKLLKNILIGFLTPLNALAAIHFQNQ